MKLIHVFLISLLLFSCKTDSNKSSTEQQDDKVVNTSEIEEYLDQLERTDSLHGVVLLADKDQILLKKAYGHKDLNKSEAHTIDGNIALASVPKMFTAIAIMQLADQGKIDINNPISQYLQELKNPIWKDSITVKNLLSHTSGLGFYWDYPPEELSDNLDSLYDVIKRRDTNPRERNVFNYSNNGYIVLGTIIQEVSGLPYQEYIAKHITNPLNMQSTQLGLPDGSSYYTSTADDLLKFSKALRSNTLIDRTILDKMISKQSENNYGLGFKLSFKGKSKIYGHTGGFASDDSGMGIASAMYILDERYTIIVLTNRNPGMGGPKALSFILNYLSKKE